MPNSKQSFVFRVLLCFILSLGTEFPSQVQQCQCSIVLDDYWWDAEYGLKFNSEIGLIFTKQNKTTHFLLKYNELYLQLLPLILHLKIWECICTYELRHLWAAKNPTNIFLYMHTSCRPLALILVEARVNSTEVHWTSTVMEIKSGLFCLHQVRLSDRGPYSWVSISEIWMINTGWHFDRCNNVI